MVCAKKFDNIMVTLRSEYNLPRDVAKHLVFNYGTRALQIAEIVRSGFGPDRYVMRSCAFRVVLPAMNDRVLT